MKDIINSLRLAITERLNSPLFGAFAVAWVCWNHRMLFVLFSTMAIKDRFDFIDTQIYKSSWDAWKIGLIFPMLTAIGFVIFYPIVSKWVYAYWHRQQCKLKKLRDEIEGAQLLTIDESRQVHMSIAQQKLEFENIISAQQREIASLKEINAAVTKELDQTRKQRPQEKEQQTPELEEGPESLIQYLAKISKGSIAAWRLPDLLKQSEQRIAYYADRAEAAGYIKRGSNEEHEVLYYLTPKGRAYAMSKGYL